MCVSNVMGRVAAVDEVEAVADGGGDVVEGDRLGLR